MRSGRRATSRRRPERVECEQSSLGLTLEASQLMKYMGATRNGNIDVVANLICC